MDTSRPGLPVLDRYGMWSTAYWPSTLDPPNVGPMNVSCLLRCPDFRGQFLCTSIANCVGFYVECPD